MANLFTWCICVYSSLTTEYGILVSFKLTNILNIDTIYDFALSTKDHTINVQSESKQST